ncbi:MAG: hypothetical protein HYZ71_04110 [Deltaproteobacteria bacterium]|nr:hypothetical protein [Deltaproteobacteria bacterium]
MGSRPYLLLWGCLFSTIWALADETRNPAITALNSVGLTINDPGSTEGLTRSLRERICTLQEYLRHSRVTTQLLHSWIEKDFSDRPEPEQKKLIKSVNNLIVASPDRSASFTYLNFLIEEPRLKAMPCDGLRKWLTIHFSAPDTELKTDGSQCEPSLRREWLATSVFSPEFVDTRMFIQFKNPPSLGGALEHMYQTSRLLGDPIAAIAIRASLFDSLSKLETQTEPFGLPPGPYACPTKLGAASEGPTLSTTFYYWFDLPMSTARPGSNLSGKWEAAMQVSPPTPTGTHYANPQWYRRELADMHRAGFNTAFFVYRGGPLGRFQYANAGLTTAAQVASESPEKFVKIAPVIDGVLFSPKQNVTHEWIDLSNDRGAAILASTIRDFLSIVPPHLRALQNGRPLVGLRNLSYARQIDSLSTQKAKIAVTKILGGVAPYIIYPRQELISHVKKGNSEATARAIERLIQGIPLEDAYAGTFSAESLLPRLGGSNLTLAKHFYNGICSRGEVDEVTRNSYWKNMAEHRSREELARFAYTRCVYNFLEHAHARLERRDAKYNPSQAINEEYAKKEAMGLLAQYFASPQFFPLGKENNPDLANALSFTILGKCPDKTDMEKLNSMLATWNRETTASYLLATHDGFHQMVSGWLVDALMISPAVYDQEIDWEGSACAIPPGIATLFPGRNDQRLSKLMKQIPTNVDRSAGILYDSLWNHLANSRQFPSFIHVESWNGYHDGTAIAPTLEFGSRYFDKTQDRLLAYLKAYKTHAAKLDRSIANVTEKKKDKKNSP